MKKIIIGVMVVLTVAFLTGCGGGGPNYPRNGMYIEKSKRTPGVVLARVPFKDGKKNGMAVYYWGGKSSGVVSEQGQWVDGKPVGVWKVWTDKGILHKSGQYDNNGKKIGVWKEGMGKRIVFEIPYVNGKMHGIYKRYYPSGKIARTTSYINGLRDGPAKVFELDGSVQSTSYWEKGDLKSEKFSAAQERMWKKQRAYLNKGYSSSNTSRKTSVSSTGASSSSSTPKLKCSGGAAGSISENQRDMAIAKGKGEGAGLGYMMNHNDAVSISLKDAQKYCYNAVNTSNLSCPSAKVYLNGCLKKLGH